MDKTVPPAAAKLLDFIGSIEAPEGYDTVFGNNQDKLTKPVTKMTIRELQHNQAGFTKAFGSSASGRYQFMRATLRDLQDELGLNDKQLMDPDLQDRLGYHLLRRRGYDKWANGDMTDNEFIWSLAKEWASIPVPENGMGAHRQLTAGQSYYAGDGVNKSQVKLSQVKTLLEEAITLADEPAPVNIDHTEPAHTPAPVIPPVTTVPVTPHLPVDAITVSQDELEAIIAAAIAQLCPQRRVRLILELDGDKIVSTRVEAVDSIG